MQNLMPIWNHWISIKKVYTKKVRVLRTYVLSTKSTSFLYFYANNFFVWIFYTFFNYAFFYTHIKMLWKKYLWSHISTFYQLWILMHTKLSKKIKTFFSNVNQNKLYFSILVSNQQGVQFISLFSSLISLFGICSFMPLIFCIRIEIACMIN